MDTHYFLAISLPDEVKELMYLKSEWYRGKWEFDKWTHPLDYHITLVFLGNIAPHSVNVVKEIVELSLFSDPELFVRLRNVHSFGDNEKPRILYQKVALDNGWLALRARLFNNLLPFFSTLDKRPFRPHITIAKKFRDESEWVLQQPNVNSERKMSEWYATEIILYRIHNDKRPSYEEVMCWDVTIDSK
ncbi:MAG: RNA 2',3'-cyclic phosphodiesterase [Bacilli bacterium]